MFFNINFEEDINLRNPDKNLMNKTSKKLYGKIFEIPFDSKLFTEIFNIFMYSIKLLDVMC